MNQLSKSILDIPCNARVIFSNRRRRTTRLLVAAFIVFAGTLQAHSTFAQSFVDSSGGVDSGVCDVPAAPCQTIAFAISTSTPPAIINLMSLAGTPNVYNESGINIPFNTEILGVSASQSVIDGNAIDRIFTVNGGNLVLNRVTLQNGNANPLAAGKGGAVLVVNGALNISQSILQKNVAQHGGAIAAEDTAGAVTVLSSLLRSNRSTANGGSIHCDGCNGVRLSRSVLLENIAGAQGGAVFVQSSPLATHSSRLIRNNAEEGGAIFANGAQVVINDSELRNNEADQGDGGGVFSAGDLSIQRSTLEGNSATENGGGVFLFGDVNLATSNSTYSANTAIAGGALLLAGNAGFGTPSALVSNSTFVDNVSTFAGQGHHVSGVLTSFEINNSILHLSPALQNTNSVCTGPVMAGVANLISDTSCQTGAFMFNLGAANGLNTSLSANGGVGRTHEIFAMSNAVDGGFPAFCINSQTGNALTVDQRRHDRPVDGDMDGLIACDVGAFELQ